MGIGAKGIPPHFRSLRIHACSFVQVLLYQRILSVLSAVVAANECGAAVGLAPTIRASRAKILEGLDIMRCLIDTHPEME